MHRISNESKQLSLNSLVFTQGILFSLKLKICRKFQLKRSSHQILLKLKATKNEFQKLEYEFCVGKLNPVMDFLLQRFCTLSN